MTSKTTNGASERTPSINGEAAPSYGENHSNHETSSTSTMGFFLDKKHTPGLHSNNFVYVGYVNFLLIAVPIGLVAGGFHWNATAVFTLNFLAIIHLAADLSYATEEISAKLGQTMGGLLNATFGNAVELIVSVVALKDGQIEVVQSSMLGSVLSNLLLVMGMCFFFGGLIHRGTNGAGTEQVFSSAVAQTTCSLMTLASASLVLPAALYAVLDQSDSAEKNKSILVLSRGTAVILLLLYVLYLAFQLRTHSNLFEIQAQAAEEGHAIDQGQNPDGGGSAGEEEYHLGPVAAGSVLVVVTLFVAICAEYLTAGISKAFIGLILIPIVGNAAEHVTAVVVAVKDKMDLAMGVAIGSSIQIALFMTPFLVIVSWIIGKDMTLHFETFETVAFAVSVLVVTYTVQDGKSNYLEGAILLGLYIIIAVAFYTIPSGVTDNSFIASSYIRYAFSA
ncbi:hypothetical protein S40288_07045 [Stachybotrys chartarum IBT 40288]|nr:hypothetical protein S40288_07045 [Stachybotrys chartarum IBT 40288]